MAIGPATSSSSSPLSSSARIGRRGIEPLDDGAMHVERDLVDLAEPHAHPGAARQALRAGHLEHQRQLVGTHQAPFGSSLIRVASSSVMPCCCRYLRVQKRSMPPWWPL